MSDVRSPATANWGLETGHSRPAAAADGRGDAARAPGMAEALTPQNPTLHHKDTEMNREAAATEARAWPLLLVPDGDQPAPLHDPALGWRGPRGFTLGPTALDCGTPTARAEERGNSLDGAPQAVLTLNCKVLTMRVLPDATASDASRHRNCTVIVQ
jgi:hypothetical protein